MKYTLDLTDHEEAQLQELAAELEREPAAVLESACRAGLDLWMRDVRRAKRGPGEELEAEPERATHPESRE